MGFTSQARVGPHASPARILPAALLWLAVPETGLLSDDKEHRRTAVTIQGQLDLTFWKGQRWRDAWNGVLCGKPV